MLSIFFSLLYSAFSFNLNYQNYNQPLKSNSPIEYFARKKAQKKSCLKPSSNLIVVNFTTSPLKVFVNNKKIGNAPAFDQKIFKEVLPVGNPVVRVSSASSGDIAVAESVFEVKKEGKKTCKKTHPIIVK